MMTMEQLCQRIIYLAHTPIHVYDDSGKQLEVYIDNGEQQDILDCDVDFRKQLLSKKDPEYPMLHLEFQQVVYGIVYAEGKTYILGPCALGHDEAFISQYLVRTHNLDADRPYRVYLVALDYFCELVAMLFEALTGRTIRCHEVAWHCFCDEQFEYNLQNKVHDVFQSMRECAGVHNPYSQEQREQAAIRNGDLRALYASFEETYVGRIGTLSHHPLRQAKNIGIVITTLACRSAIAGGLIPETAFSMSDAYIQKIEEVKNEAEAYALIRQIEVEYCRVVQELSVKSGGNQIVQRCKELIFQNLYGKLTSQQLAEQLEITPSYLSRLFVKEEGMKLTDFIAQKKVEAAKAQLRFSDTSYTEIAGSLGFVSQSHMGQVFKKWAGVTPKQYRELYSEHKNC